VSAPRQGFFIEVVSVTGQGLPNAEVTFRDGLNVVAGASDTGKSYLLDLIDFVFGASKPPRRINAAQGYERVVLRLRDRATGDSYEIERSLAGGDLRIRPLRADGQVLAERVAAARHDANDPNALSAFLLKLSGFAPSRVRKNKKGDTQSLSFRNLAFLCLVDEARIIEERPPQLSGNPIELTPEGDVFRLLVTGHPSPAPILAPKKATGPAAKAQAELLGQMQAQVREAIAALGLEPGGVREELDRLDAARAVLLSSYEARRLELVASERQLAGCSRELRAAESRLLVLEGLLARFQLLDGHYHSDIDRLTTIEETGALLESVPATACPVCGAPPAAHRSEDAATHFGVSAVRQAAAKEIEKTKELRTDLHRVLVELRSEVVEREGLRAQLQGQAAALQAQIATELHPQTRTSLEKVREQDARRDSLLRARSLVEQLEDLDRRAATATKAGKRTAATTSAVPAEVTTSEMEPFAESVQEILAAWHYPGLGRVVFSEDSQDLVIGGEERASHGKGVRALTCAAFIAGILRHCWTRGLPHPGLVLLDSPLVAYQDPDTPGSESERLRQAGVKEAFYRSLTQGFCPGQVIVLENADPPDDLAGKIAHHHFSKAATGRYGLFREPR